MSFRQLKQRVERAEHRVELRSQQALAGLCEMNRIWRAGWTPLRIVIAGLATGFVAGRAEPMSVVGRLGEIRWAQIISIVSTLVTGIQTMVADGLAAVSEMDFGDDGSGSAPAATGGDGVSRRESTGHSDEDVVPPRPAEAATELAPH
ncbi:MAG: hypothetical protein LBL59_08295 [Xanthomonadaceae bacterium]|jgi:hypothetical protein|nr:hypothetical protein [Xanthomonadaceae bacterium]